MLSNLLTGKDNQTHDISRVLGFVSVLSGIFFQVVSLFMGLPFDLISYGMGITSLLVGTSASVKLKETTEPTP